MYSGLFSSARRSVVHSFLFAGAVAGVCLSASAQETAGFPAGVTDTQVNAWHQNLKNYAPLEEGCFTTSYPLVQWKKVPCGPKPNFVSSRRPNGRRALGTAQLSASGPQTVGNGNDYAAQTSGITNQGVGTFPTVTGVTSEKGVGVAAFGGGGELGSNEYTLQLNTDINPSATACSAFGYSSCYVWEQFIYATAPSGYASSVFIQNWVFPSTNDYNNRGCPSGWNDASSSGDPACYKNSSATAAPTVAATKLANLKLSGSTSSTNDTVIFTNGTQAYSASEKDSTVHLQSWWKNSEFNVVGNGDGSEAVFNKGASVTVNLAVKDGTTTAPKCLSNSGTTGETNNLTAGSCKATGGSALAISFTESD